MKHLKRIFHFNELDSTSAFLKRGRFSLRNFTFISCDFQTDGHGRLGRSWVSPKNENLMFSVLIKDEDLIKNFSSLSLCSAVSILKVLQKLSLNDISIKWPNDVYVNGKKICGILLESVADNNQMSNVIVGIGLNVNTTEFIGEFISPPTSIALESCFYCKLKKIKSLVYKQIKKDFIKLKKVKSDYLSIAKQYNYLKGKTVFAEINNKKTEIKVLDICEDNSLLCEIDGQKQNIFSGEITFHL